MKKRSARIRGKMHNRQITVQDLLNRLGMSPLQNESDWSFRKRLFPSLFKEDIVLATEFFLGCDVAEWNKIDRETFIYIVGQSKTTHTFLVEFAENFPEDPVIARGNKKEYCAPRTIQGSNSDFVLTDVVVEQCSVITVPRIKPSKENEPRHEYPKVIEKVIVSEPKKAMDNLKREDPNKPPNAKRELKNSDDIFLEEFAASIKASPEEREDFLHLVRERRSSGKTRLKGKRKRKISGNKPHNEQNKFDDPDHKFLEDFASNMPLPLEEREQFILLVEKYKE